MKRTAVISAAAVAVLLLAWAFAQVPANVPADISRLVPAGPLLYLEARDFGALLRDWNGSDEKKLWLASDNFQVFSRSRLFLKLQQAQTEFASAAGVPPDMDLLGNVAGSRSAIAIYDIGKLEFLYITRLPSDRFAGGALWKIRGNYQPRQSAGIDYYVKTDPASQRVSAFAAAKDYVLLSTREDVLAGALALLAGQNSASVATETWFDKAARERKSPGELRLVMNLEQLTLSAHFRSYWIQQNITELKQYTAAIADVERASNELREDRALIRNNEIPASWNEAAVGELLAFAPANAALYRAWASPSPEEAFELLRRKLLEPRRESRAAAKTAPVVSLGDGSVGNEADLETRIDDPPLETSAPIAEERRKLFGGVKLEAMLDVGATRTQPDGVFVGTDFGLVLLASSNWNVGAVRDAISAAIARLVSTANLGGSWQERRTGANVYYQLDGLAPLVIATKDRVLAVSNRKELLEAMLAGVANPQAGTGARYAARYMHSQELPNFAKMMHLIDAPLAKDTPPDAAEPAFFSGNLASLGQTLGRVDSESIVVHDTGAVVTQNVVYRLK